jgi:alkyl hydroperoxide reductase subunit AhpF
MLGCPKQIALVGGGNSAGQAAVFLSGFAAKIFMLGPFSRPHFPYNARASLG